MFNCSQFQTDSMRHEVAVLTPLPLPGMAMTETSSTMGWVKRMFSTSMEEMFSPPGGTKKARKEGTKEIFSNNTRGYVYLQ